MPDLLRQEAGYLAPLLDPPFALEPPRLLLPARPAAFPAEAPFRDVLPETADGNTYRVSTHIFPGAWPRMRLRSVQNRSARFVPLHLARPLGKGREALAKETQWYFDHNEEVGYIDLGKRETFRDQDQLWLAANRYVSNGRRRGPAPGFTLILTHANGMHKETYEPLIAHLLASRAGTLIDEVWSVDCVVQGDSSLLNRDKLGDAMYWPDYARDLANLALRYLPPLGQANDPTPPAYVLERQELEDPTLLGLDSHSSSPLSIDAAHIPKLPGLWRGRRIVPVGHSMGGGSHSIAFTSLPSLISGFVLLDSITIPRSLKFRDRHTITATAVRRRDRWPTRDDAGAEFALKQDFFGKWQPGVLTRYIAFGLARVSPDAAEVELKGRKQDEALVFADPVPRSSEQMAGSRLAFMPEWLKKRTLFIHPLPNQTALSESALDDIIELARGCTRVRVNSGHLIVQEQPREAAIAIAAFLSTLSEEQVSAAKL